MELYFVDDQPKIILESKKYARVRPGYEQHTFDGLTYYTANALSYKEAIDHLKTKVQQIVTGSASSDFKRMLHSGTGRIIDGGRGDGFTFMMVDMDDWGELLANLETPEVYK